MHRRSIDQLDGWLTQPRAKKTLGITSDAYLRELVLKGKIEAANWDSRTLIYKLASLEQFVRERDARKYTLPPKAPRVPFSE